MERIPYAFKAGVTNTLFERAMLDEVARGESVKMRHYVETGKYATRQLPKLLAGQASLGVGEDSCEAAIPLEIASQERNHAALSASMLILLAISVSR